MDNCKNGWMAMRVAAVVFALALAMPVSADEDLASYVDPLVGSVGEGNTFPGTCRPFGLVQASPDTGEQILCSGYKHSDTTIRGFSQTHLNGTGCPGMGDISLMPFVGEDRDVDFDSPFDKANQTCAPDYYSVVLERGNIRAEATSTERTAWWRFTFPKGGRRRLFVDASSSLMQPFNLKFGPRNLDADHSLSEDRTEICGSRTSQGWGAPYYLAYSIRFGEAWSAIRRLPANAFDGKGDRFVLEFAGDGVLDVQIGLSCVSAPGARANRESELDGKTFESVRMENRAAWNELLSRARIVRGTDEQKRNWYTSLYHLCIQPNIQSDVDGRYRGAGDVIRKGVRYSTFSLWDTFRAAHPLYTILVPERIEDFVSSLVGFGKEHGHLPVWPMFNYDGHCMIGMPVMPVLVDAWEKGFRTADAEDLLGMMVRSMMNNDGEYWANCWNAYWENGYIPYKPGKFDRHFNPSQTVSRTLELAYAWWCIAHFAELTGNERTAREARHWAECWKNVFDERSGFVRPRAPKTDGGAWREPFDPRVSRVPGELWDDFTEANSWIYTWHVFQDPDGLARLMGGREKACAKLDEFFSTPHKGAGSSKNGRIGQYWHGNEPSHHVAYFYAVLGQPEKTARLVRTICRDFYKPTPEGLCGNDDCGQMSAWYMFSMMGFYPFNPCGGGYVIGAPQAEEIELETRGADGKARKLSIRAENLSPKNIYVKSVLLDGKEIDGVRLTHEQIVSGGELVFTMCEGGGGK